MTEADESSAGGTEKNVHRQQVAVATPVSASGQVAAVASCKILWIVANMQVHWMMATILTGNSEGYHSSMFE